MLHGRGPELAVIDRVLEDARLSRSSALVVRGAPGVGKTSLLSYATERAADMRVLKGAGVESESDLAYASLHQILLPALDHIGAIPELQATALRGALGLAPATAPDRFHIAVALLSVLSELARVQPLLCVVDDLQWLDPASADALTFVARRLDAEGIAMLFTSADPTGPPARDPGLPQLSLPGLERDAADALLVERLGIPPAPRVGDYLWELTRGNPLGLIEISAGLTTAQVAGQDSLPDHPKLGDALEHSLLRRIRTLPEPTQTLLLLAAAEGSGDLRLVLRAAASMGSGHGSLEPAEMAGLVKVDGGGIWFRYPLMRSAVYQGAASAKRTAVHRALAAALELDDDPERRTWHRAAGAVGPDDEVADDLEASAMRARLRGGFSAAAAALERSAALTSTVSKAGRRLAAAAMDAWLAGRPDRTSALVARAGSLVSDPQVRADLEFLRGINELMVAGNYQVGYEILLSASELVATLDPRMAARMLALAARAAWSDADIPRTTEAGRRMASLELPPESPEALEVDLLSGVTPLLEGNSAAAAPMIRKSLAYADFHDPLQLVIAGSTWSFIGSDREAHYLLTRAATRARSLGAIASMPLSLHALAQLETLQGDFQHGTVHASEGLRLARETGQSTAAAHCLSVLAWIAAVQGRDEECASSAAEALELGHAHRLRSVIGFATWALALSDIGRGRWSDAIIRLESVVGRHSPESHPMVAFRAASDLVEAGHRVGRLDLARSTLALFEEYARPTGARWMLALVARCRALLSSGTEAQKSFDDALELHEEGGRPFDEARTRLLYGVFLRRERRRADARSHLRHAIETFERLDASPWEQRAGAELRATGETARKREPNTHTQLTPQEIQIVRLVAEGTTNKEVAAHLFLSPRTVDYHLRNVFVKLGISSRAELIRLQLQESVPA